MNKKGQSSIEFLLALPIVFLIAIFISGEFSNLTKSTIALASAKESFYEKTIDASEAIIVKKLEYIICNDQSMKINILTIPGNITMDSALIAKIKSEAEQTSGIQPIDITLNSSSLPDTC